MSTKKNFIENMLYSFILFAILIFCGLFCFVVYAIYEMAHSESELWKVIDIIFLIITEILAFSFGRKAVINLGSRIKTCFSVMIVPTALNLLGFAILSIIFKNFELTFFAIILSVTVVSSLVSSLGANCESK